MSLYYECRDCGDVHKGEELHFCKAFVWCFGCETRYRRRLGHTCTYRRGFRADLYDVKAKEEKPMCNCKCDENLKPGDVVKLKSGGPDMTVGEKLTTGFLCYWFADNYKRESAAFSVSSLKLVPKS